MKHVFLCAVLLSSCGFSDPRTPSLSEDSKLQILFKAQQTANWATWCEDFPSNENCADGDSMAGSLGFLCAVGFEPSCLGVTRSVTDSGQLKRSPVHKPTENTASRDQLMGFMAAQLNAENRWLDVKRFIKRHGKICLDATDNRCDLTPNIWGLIGGVHSFLGYNRDASMLLNSLVWDHILLMQSMVTPPGYQLNLMAESAWLAWKTGIETQKSYEAGIIVWQRQPTNPWFCIVVLGPDETCAKLALEQWPNEPQRKFDWAIQRATDDPTWYEPSGWGWLFIAGLFGVDLNQLAYSGKRYSKDSPQPH